MVENFTKKLFRLMPVLPEYGEVALQSPKKDNIIFTDS